MILDRSNSLVFTSEYSKQSISVLNLAQKRSASFAVPGLPNNFEIRNSIFLFLNRHEVFLCGGKVSREGTDVSLKDAWVFNLPN
jgi:hypothetical protein